MTTIEEQKRLVANLVPELVRYDLIYNCHRWINNDYPITDREWLFVCHEAEKKQNTTYWYQLGKVVGINFGKVIFDIRDMERIANATTEQRLEALCHLLSRTILERR